MKKMKTLFKRQFKDNKKEKCYNEVEPDCKWVLDGQGWATEKIDGTCCLISDGKIYRRYDYKKGKKLPKGAIPCQDAPDPITGHFPHWVLCTEDDTNSKYYLEAYKRQKHNKLKDGTYELIGKHINANPYNLDTDILEKHGERILKDVPRDYEGIKKYLKEHYIEGIVFYRGDGEMCKIKRSDFGFEWNQKRKKEKDIEELIDVLDEDGNKTGRIETRSKVHEIGLWHRIVAIALIDSKGQLLMQKRTMTKKSNPGKWDLSVAGHVSAGESSIEAVLKEVREEIGLHLNEKDLKYILTTKKVSTKDNIINKHIIDCYIAIYPEIDINKLKLQESEVEQVKLCNLQEVKEMVNSKVVIERDVFYKEIYKYLK